MKSDAFSDFTAEVLSSKADIVLISESRMKPSRHPDSDFVVDGFSNLRLDRSGRRGGGVFAMIRNELAPNLYFKNRVINRLFEYLRFKCNDLSSKNKYFYCVIYHPPNPKYDVDSLVDQLLKDSEDIAMSNPAAIISIIGDINHMNTTRFETEAGMSQLVQQVTHGNNILD